MAVPSRELNSTVNKAARLIPSYNQVITSGVQSLPLLKTDLNKTATFGGDGGGSDGHNEAT